jgi:hypothetical protein
LFLSHGNYYNLFSEICVQLNGDALTAKGGIKKFQNENPNVVVKVEAIDHDVYETKSKTLTAANQLC